MIIELVSKIDKVSNIHFFDWFDTI